MATAPILGDEGGDADAGSADAGTDTGTAAVVDAGQGSEAAAAGNEAGKSAANDDWRTAWAGEDKDALKFLGRDQGMEEAERRDQGREIHRPAAREPDRRGDRCLSRADRRSRKAGDVSRKAS